MPNVPIRNLYFLLLYAWDKFPEGSEIDVGTDDSPELPNLLGRLLVAGTHRLLRRGLDRGYQLIDEELRAPRGRLLLSETAKRNSQISGRVACAYDELSRDVAHNRILRAGLRSLAQSGECEPALVAEASRLQARMVDIAEFKLSRNLFRPLQLSRNTGHYGLLMKICEMLLELSMPEQGGSGSKFTSILEDELRMSALFEAFVRNFYRLEQSEFKVGSEIIGWDAWCHDPTHSRYLPAMLTDVTMRSKMRTIVIDAKFYKETFVSHLGGQQKVRSPHLYQLLAYLRNMESREGPDGFADGLLLYPSIDKQEVQLEFLMGKHLVRVATVSLERPWRAIHSKMLSLLDKVDRQKPHSN